MKDVNNPRGEIEIKTIGLREGEKLYEELLVDNNAQVTKHPLIFKEKESNLNFTNIQVDIQKLIVSIKNNNLFEVQSLLKKQVPEWNSNQNNTFN